MQYMLRGSRFVLFSPRNDRPKSEDKFVSELGSLLTFPDAEPIILLLVTRICHVPEPVKFSV
jgi:hypothetical protein